MIPKACAAVLAVLTLLALLVAVTAGALADTLDHLNQHEHDRQHRHKDGRAPAPPRHLGAAGTRPGGPVAPGTMTTSPTANQARQSASRLPIHGRSVPHAVWLRYLQFSYLTEEIAIDALKNTLERNILHTEGTREWWSKVGPNWKLEACDAPANFRTFLELVDSLCEKLDAASVVRLISTDSSKEVIQPA